MENYGILIGTAPVFVVSAAGLLLGRKATAQVKQFREEQQERFRGRANHG